MKEDFLSSWERKQEHILFLDKLNSIEDADYQLDYLYKKIDELFLNKKIYEIEEIIFEFLKQDFSFLMHLGFLTITISNISNYNSPIKNRDILYKQAFNKGLLKHGEIKVNRMLKGLS